MAAKCLVRPGTGRGCQDVDVRRTAEDIESVFVPHTALCPRAGSHGPTRVDCYMFRNSASQLYVIEIGYGGGIRIMKIS